MHGIQNTWWNQHHYNVKPVSRRPWFPWDLRAAQAVLFISFPVDGPELAPGIPAINADGLIVVDTIEITDIKNYQPELFQRVVWPWFKRILVEGWTPGFVAFEVEDRWFVRVYGPLGTDSEVERDRK